MSAWLEDILQESQRWGFLGPGPVSAHVEHSLGFARAWEAVRAGPPDSLIDLGSGGGIPGLVLAEHWGIPVRLVDSMVRRTRFLEEAAASVGAPPRVTVTCERAETLARSPEWERSTGLVTARSFGPPAVVAECATRFLVPGGLLIVSEPPATPASPSRWSDAGLRALGLETLRRVDEPAGYQVLVRSGSVDARYPRRPGVPVKRPLF